MISASPIRIGTANFAIAAARAVSNVASPIARTNPNGFGADDAASSSSSGGQAISPLARKRLAVDLEVSAQFDILFLLRPLQNRYKSLVSDIAFWILQDQDSTTGAGCSNA
jgi:hypothetical protein